MGKSDRIVRHVNEMPQYDAYQCQWHVDCNCLVIHRSADGRTKTHYHAVFVDSSNLWKSINPNSGSCDIPEEIYDMIALNRELGDGLVLPFAFHFRERSGATLGLFRLADSFQNPSQVGVPELARAFYLLVVILCSQCRRFGGTVPVLKHSSFVYDPSGRPVLANVGDHHHHKRDRGEGTRRRKRMRMGDEPPIDKRQWHRFLAGGKTCIEVMQYLRVLRPELFRNKYRGGDCLLRANLPFDDVTHQLICRNRNATLIKVLEQFSSLIRDDERLSASVQKWIRDFRQHRLRLVAERQKAQAKRTVVACPV